MNSMKRRREMILFAIMLSSCIDLAKKERTKKLWSSLFLHLNPMDVAMTRYVPQGDHKARELANAQDIISKIAPFGFLTSPDEYRVWYVCQLAKRLVASGWTLPRDKASVEFVQAMYNMADTLALAKPPPRYWIDNLVKAVQYLKSIGMYSKET